MNKLRRARVGILPQPLLRKTIMRHAAPRMRRAATVAAVGQNFSYGARCPQKKSGCGALATVVAAWQHFSHGAPRKNNWLRRALMG